MCVLPLLSLSLYLLLSPPLPLYNLPTPPNTPFHISPTLFAQERVIGLHVTGPSAGEMTQGYAVAIRMRATKDDFDATIGIHPTVSENFTTLEKTKSSGEDPQNTGC